jgi:DNA-binding NarL/FixJ family response regulator
MVSIYDDTAHRAAALSAGAKAFVSKRAIRKELISTIERVMADVH